MTTQARKTKGRTRGERRFHDPQGAEVKTHDEAFAARAPSEAAGSAECGLTLHNGAVTFTLKVKYDPNTYPHVVTGGQITSGIHGAPWDIKGGHLGETLRLDATRTPQGTGADTITIVGEYQNPPAYRGTYGYNGTTSSFRHTTRYEC